MADLEPVLADLIAEGADLERMVAELPDDGWALPTPAPGWTIAHQIAHLAWTDDKAILAATDEAAFILEVKEAWTDPQGYLEAGAAAGTQTSPSALLARWQASRTELAATLRAIPVGEKRPWFGPPMGAVSMASGRLMETWAHGQDVADTLGVERPATARLWSVANIGIRARDFAFGVNDRTAPAEPFRIELTAPDGSAWVWGPADAAQRVTGTALDFCLRATQRRHRDDLGLVATGTQADEWLDIAQAFAGAPGRGREPGGVSA
jgi:uncharacterized protein (TIGR03084 family)